MSYLLGLLVGTTAFFLALRQLQQGIDHYYDVVAMVMVLGGTLAVAVITLPWHGIRDFFRAAQLLLGVRRSVEKQVVRQCILFVSSPLNTPTMLRGITGSVLKDGDELISLGFSAQKIEEILDTRISESFERLHKIVNAIRSLSKYPPAFGLMGTVLGLVSLMRAVSAGLEARQTGVQMAVALTATLYGLVVANILVAPAGELLLRVVLDEKKMAEIALRAVLLKISGANPLEAQEMLNSFVSESNRANVIQLQSEGKAA